jgi:large subunit ribosomal protein L17
MRHQRKINHLGRTSSHRKAMLSNMAASLILHKRITTTVAKAKVLRTYVEPLLTKSKDDSTHSRRVVFSYLQNKLAVTELFRDVSKKIAERPGGYTRILKTGYRAGDNADMCIIELVDYNEAMLAPREEKAKTSRRKRATGAKKKAGKEPEAKIHEEKAHEAPVTEQPETPAEPESEEQK